MPLLLTLASVVAFYLAQLAINWMGYGAAPSAQSVTASVAIMALYRTFMEK